MPARKPNQRKRSCNVDDDADLLELDHRDWKDDCFALINFLKHHYDRPLYKLNTAAHRLASLDSPTDNQRQKLEREHEQAGRFLQWLSLVKNNLPKGLPQEQFEQVVTLVDRAIESVRKYRPKVKITMQAIWRQIKLEEKRQAEVRRIVYFGPVREFAATRKGIGRRLLELVIAGSGRCPLADIANDLAIRWKYPYDKSWESQQRTLNRHLKKIGFVLFRDASAACLKPIPQKSRRKKG